MSERNEPVTTTARERVGAMLQPSEVPPLPEEYQAEIEERSRWRGTPATIAVLSVQDVHAAARTVAALQEASVRATFAEDWVRFPGTDGTQFGFLQDKGCARLRGLWGISFEGIDQRRDILEEELQDGHVAITVQVTARCAITGEEALEYGFRSTAGFFAKRWDQARKDGSFVEMARLRADVRKAAIANGRGRAIRTLCGVAGVPVDRLRALGLAPEKMAGAEFQRGGGGGSQQADGASDAQLNLLVRQLSEKCGHLAPPRAQVTLEQVQAWVRGAALTKRAISPLIERLGKAKRNEVRIEELAMLGPPPWAAGPGGEVPAEEPRDE